jgi:ADP-ribose pyrophosphatase
MNKPKIKLLESTILAQVRHFQFVRDRFIGLNNFETEMAVVRHPGAVVILPLLASGEIVFVRQYRYAINEFILELPAGSLDKKDPESPIDCAQREISEEIGYRANKWSDLGTLYPTPGFCDELQYLFLAEDLSPYSLPGDQDEVIEVEQYSYSQVEKMIISGELRDAKSIATLFRAKLMGLI